jgi:hypothetical protein
VPLANSSNVYEVDRRLGYQVPRVWFPHPHLQTSSGPLDVNVRPNPTEKAKRPHTSGLVVSEYFRIEASRRYLELTNQDPNHPLYRDNEVLKSLSTAMEAWTPGAGLTSPTKLSSQALLSPSPQRTTSLRKSSNRSHTSRVVASTMVVSPAKKQATSSPKTEKPLAGYAYTMGTKRRKQAWSVGEVLPP